MGKNECLGAPASQRGVNGPCVPCDPRGAQREVVGSSLGQNESNQAQTGFPHTNLRMWGGWLGAEIGAVGYRNPEE